MAFSIPRKGPRNVVTSTLNRYAYMQDEATIVVNMSAEDLQQKYDGNLNSEMTGPLHNLIAKVGLAEVGHAIFF